MQKDFKVKRTSAGLGLITTRPFKKGEFVIEYTGEKITDEEANRRGNKYLFELDNGYTVDGVARKNLARYINHACRPNCEPEIDEDEERILIYAKRTIKPGEELTYNYGKEYFNQYIKPKGCKCTTCSTSASKK